MDSPTLAPPNPAIAAAAQQAQQPGQAPPAPNLPAGAMGGQTPQQALQAMPAQQAPQVTPAHVSVAQRLLGGLFGTAAPTYAVDPKTGQQVETPGAPQKPGAFFRNILAASMLGGAAAAGQNPAGGFWGGVGNGARAVQANAKQQDLMKQQQAQKDFENKNAADKNARENSAAATQEKLAQAQIITSNAETLRTNVMTQGLSWAQHKEQSDRGVVHLQPYKDAGLQPVEQDVPEIEMMKTVHDRVVAGLPALDWEPTDVKAYNDPKTGQPGFQYTYTGYDPKGTVPISKEVVAQWKKDGLDKSDPLEFGMVSNLVDKNQPVEALQYNKLKEMDAKLYNDNYLREKNDLTSKEGLARIAASNAEVAKDLAEKNRANAETGAINETKNETEARGAALDELNKVGGDISKLSPKSKIVLSESARGQISSLDAEAKILIDSGDQAGAKDRIVQADQWRSLAQQMLGGQADPKVAATVASLKGKTPSEVATALQNPLIPEASKPAIWQGLGMTPVAAAPVVPKPGLLKKAAGVYTEATGAMQSGVKKAVNAAGNWVDTGSPFTPPQGQ